MIAAIKLIFKALLSPFNFLFKRFFNFLAEIPDLTAQGAVLLTGSFFILLLGFKNSDYVLIQLSILCYFIFFGTFLFSFLNIRSLSIRRTIPEYVFAKEEFQVKLVIENNKEHLDSFWINLYDDFYKKGKSDFLSFPMISSNEVLDCEYTAILRRRGVYKKFAFRLTSSFPFGFLVKQKYGYKENLITVFPDPQLPIHFKEILSTELGFGGQSNNTSLDRIGEFKGLREYTPGDSIKNIHWPAYHSYGKLVTNEIEPPSPEEVVVIFFTYVPEDVKKIKKLRKSFEQLMQFLSGLFIFLNENSTAFKFVSNFNNFKTINVLPDQDSLQKGLVNLARAKEKKEGQLDHIGAAIQENSKGNTKLIIISNTPKSLWAEELNVFNAELIDGSIFKKKRKKRTV